MSRKGFQYEYRLSSEYPQEFEAVSFAYLQAGWKVISAIPETGLPTQIVFEWTKDSPPHFPPVNWP